jgi:hypothetical protein
VRTTGAPAREHDAATDCELVVERGRHPLGRRGHGDRVERRPVGRSEPAVADAHLDRAVARDAQRRPRPDGEHLEPLDRDHARRELVEHGGAVARAGADVEHPLRALQREQRAHRGHDVRLGDRLALPDREGGVVVGVRHVRRRDEGLAGHALHRRQNALVLDPAATQLAVDHPRPQRRGTVGRRDGHAARRRT